MSPQVTSSTALAALRAATRRHHDHVETVLDVSRLTDGGRYGRVLLAFDAFLQPWEARVAAALPDTHGWLRQRSRLGFLRADLASLGLDPRQACGHLPELATPAAAWGSLYVMEGSALGGQVIARQLDGRGEGASVAYFRGFGSATGRMWTDFCRRLGDALDGDAVATHEACEAACATFQTLALHLQQTVDERAALA